MKKLLLLLGTVSLAACSSVINTPKQPITIKFTNAGGQTARCVFENKHYKHEVIAPGTFLIQNSEDPMEVYCKTANGKAGSQILEPKIADEAYLNVMNGWIGAYADYWSRGGFVYPSEVIMNFELDAVTIVKQSPPKTYLDQMEEEYQEDRQEAIDKANAVLSGSGRHNIMSFSPSDHFKANPDAHTAKPVYKGDPALEATKERIEAGFDSPLDLKPADAGNN